MLEKILIVLASQLNHQRAWLVLALLAAIYYLNNFICGRILGGFAGSYLLPAFVWGLLALIILRLPQRRPAAKPRFKKMLDWLAFFAGVGSVMAGYALGLVQGLGKSPYDLTFRGILINIFSLGFMVMGMELSRSWFLNTVFRRRPVAGVMITAFIYSFFWFPIAKMVSFSAALDVAKFVGSNHLPALAENILISYFSFWAGLRPALIYRGIILACHWLAPILPNFNWITQALVGTFTPAFLLAFIHQLFMGEVSRLRKKSADAGSPAGWIATSAVCVLMIWFSLGVFNYFPTAIVSGSMAPEIEKGDVVIVKRAPSAVIDVGDIILFKGEEARIAHRVVEVGQGEEKRGILWTKGDANNSRDVDPVLPEQVIGPVVYRIPKAGWLAIWLRSRNN